MEAEASTDLTMFKPVAHAVSPVRACESCCYSTGADATGKPKASTDFYMFLRNCLKLIDNFIEMIFRGIFASRGGSIAGYVTDETWRKAPEKTSRKYQVFTIIKFTN